MHNICLHAAGVKRFCLPTVDADAYTLSTTMWLQSLHLSVVACHALPSSERRQREWPLIKSSNIRQQIITSWRNYAIAVSLIQTWKLLDCIGKLQLGLNCGGGQMPKLLVYSSRLTSFTRILSKKSQVRLSYLVRDSCNNAAFFNKLSSHGSKICRVTGGKLRKVCRPLTCIASRLLEIANQLISTVNLLINLFG